MIAEKWWPEKKFRTPGDEPKYTVWIGDVHGEYPLPDEELIDNDNKGFPARIQSIWDSNAVEELLTFKTKPTGSLSPPELTDFIKRFPESLQMYAEHGYIWQIYGTEPQLIEVFEKFWETVHPELGPAGGDDDSFDYWPNAIEMLEQMATDLDKITKTRKFTRRLEKAQKEYHKKDNEFADEIWPIS